jgi:hypothetical protein
LRQLSGTVIVWSFSGCVPDRDEQPADVGVVEAGDGLAEADGDPGGEGGGCGVPVDGGHGDTVAGAVLGEPAGEVTAVQERAVGDEEFSAGFERAEAGGAGAERRGKVIDVHEDLRVLSGWRR